MPDVKYVRNRFDMNNCLATRSSSENILGKREHQFRRNAQFPPSNVDKYVTILFHADVHLLCIYFPLSLGRRFFLN